MTITCVTALNQKRQHWYTMANVPFEYNFSALRKIRPLLVLICVYRLSAADLSLSSKPMNRILLIATPLTAAFLVVFFCHTPSAGAQEAHQHQHEHSEKLGRVTFPVSCTPQARKQFNRAVAWLHSFEYEEAEKAFTEVTVTDPRCGMGYWGIAMSNYHPIWAPPNAAELQKGLAAIEKARSTGARTQRERDYIAAIEGFYKASD